MDEAGEPVATALITGPTSGIGRGYARALAEKGFDLVLVARHEDSLRREADEIAKDFAVACEVLVADLSRPDDVEQVARRLQDPARPVSVLVNNAGFGLKKSFEQSSIDDERALVDVLVTAVMRLTHAVLPSMVSSGRGWIINVSSVASWFPGGTYSAAKSWVTVFSESVSLELAGTGVRVIAVCPGFVRTEFHQRAGMNMSGMPEWMWLSVDEVVSQTWRDLALSRPVSVASVRYRAISRLMRHGPPVLGRNVTRTRQRSDRMGARK